MKAIRVHSPGGPEVLRYEDVPEPTPKPGEAVVKLEAIGLNFIDTYFRMGLYPAQMPITLGQEGAGTVTSVGPGVTEVKVGDRVAYTGVPGAYAEYAAVPVCRRAGESVGSVAPRGEHPASSGVDAAGNDCSLPHQLQLPAQAR